MPGPGVVSFELDAVLEMSDRGQQMTETLLAKSRIRLFRVLAEKRSGFFRCHASHVVAGRGGNSHISCHGSVPETLLRLFNVTETELRARFCESDSQVLGQSNIRFHESVGCSLVVGIHEKPDPLVVKLGRILAQRLLRGDRSENRQQRERKKHPSHCFTSAVSLEIVFLRNTGVSMSARRKRTPRHTKS